MNDLAIYKNIAERTQGDIYIGVVGPVRTGKSTFIKRFMEALVLPNIQNQYGRDRARDEMPQSAAGKTIMTCEPKFVPDEAVEINLPDNTAFKVKMIDCVGYIVPGAIGNYEDGNPRYIMTPWSDDELPFDTAAEIGTQKVINEHSTIGVVVTTDGSFGEIERDNFISAEERVINELKQINKPFVIVLNSSYPNSEEAISLAYEMETKYKVPVALVNCLDLSNDDIRSIIELVLYEFPIKAIAVELPDWINSLQTDHWLYTSIMNSVKSCAAAVTRTGQLKSEFKAITTNESVKSCRINRINLGEGNASISISLRDGLYYEIISEMTGLDIQSEESILPLLAELSQTKVKYDRIALALEDVIDRGYGIVTPGIDDLTLEEPEIVKQSGGYGVKLKASAPSIQNECIKYMCRFSANKGRFYVQFGTNCSIIRV